MYTDISSTDISIKSTNENAINESIHNILFTKIGELPGLPTFGSRLYQFLFDLADDELEYMFRKEIEFVLETWERRIEIDEVIIKMDYDYNRIVIEIMYFIKKDIRDDYSSKFISFTMKR